METIKLKVAFVGSNPKGIYKETDQVPTWATHVENCEVDKQDYDSGKINITNIKKYL